MLCVVWLCVVRVFCLSLFDVCCSLCMVRVASCVVVCCCELLQCLFVACCILVVGRWVLSVVCG